MIARQFHGGRGAGRLADVKDEVILAQPALVWLDHGGRDAFQLLPDHGLDPERKIYVPHPATGQTDQGFPVARERELVDDADNAVIVVLDLAFEALAGVQQQRIEWSHYRGPF